MSISDKVVTKILTGTLAVLCLSTAIASNAQAYGVKVHQPILVGSLAGAVYSEYMQMLTESGAVPCDIAVHSMCTHIHLAVVTGKRGRNRYIVGTATSMYINNDTSAFLFAETRVVKHSESLRRSKAVSFTASEWGIDQLDLSTDQMDLRN